MRFQSRFANLSAAVAASCLAASLPMARAQMSPQARSQVQRKEAGSKSHPPTPGNVAANVHGIAIANMDRSVLPGDDFYSYANGAWIQRTVIPEDRARVGVFTTLLDRTNKRTETLIRDAASSNAAAGSNRRKIADLYNSYMDRKAIEARGLDPLRPHLRAIAAVRNKRELAFALGKTLRADVDPLNNTNFHTSNLFGLWVAPGFHETGHYIPYLLEGGLVLPNREYYLDKDPHMQKIRAAYRKYVAAMLERAGFKDAEARAGRVVALEHAIAETHSSLAEDEDIHRADNIWKQSDFATKAPGLDWAEYFRGAGLQDQTTFNVWQPHGVAGESALVVSTPLETWKDWMALHVIAQYAGVLPKRFADENFDLFGKTLHGIPKQRPRWQRGVALVNELLGDAVGQIYAKEYFPPESKAKVQAMVTNIVAAYRARIQALPWMAPKTKAQAEAKLQALYVGVGYPDTWKSYSRYTVKTKDAFGNLWRGRLFRYHRQIARLGKAVDRKEWSMEPQTVNAVNLPLQVALNFPAAILQPPFFDPKAPPAANYGAIGAIIGHEISHTFDTEGSMIDAQGRLHNWWTPADLKHFQEAAASLVAQYSAYTPLPGLRVNGEQTIAEDIADLAGLSAAYDAFHVSLDGKPAPVLHGFSGDQQFFISFGQTWASKIRPAALRQQVLTDPHAPARYRADTVRNVDAWYKAFQVKPGQKLYLTPKKRVQIW